MKKKITMYVASMLLGCTTLVGSIYAQTNLQSNEIHVSIQPKVIKGIEMVPLREVSEKLGFSVQWSNEENTIYLDDGIMNTKLKVGVDSYLASSSIAIGVTKPQNFGIGPLLIEGKVYVPAEMFCALLGNNENAVVTLNGMTTFIKNLESSAKGENQEKVQLPNPFTKHSSLEELKNAVGFEFKIPSHLPAGYELSSISDISNKMVDIRWSKENNKMIYRVAKGDEEDISGDYNEYSTLSSINIEGIDVVLKGNGDKIYVATWQKGQLVYALTTTEGLSQQEIRDLIK